MTTFDHLQPLKNVVLKFSEEQLTEISKWFDENAKPLLVINDDAPIDVITVANLMQFLELKKFHRRSFSCPSYGDIMREAEALKAGITRILTKDQVIYILNKGVILPEIKHELILAFKVFDTEKRNFLDIEDLSIIVTNYKDPFTSDEVQELLRDANVKGDGNVIYEDFVESLFKLAPELYDIKAEYLYDNPDEDPSVPQIIVEEPEPAPPEPTPTKPAPLVKKEKKKTKKK